MALTATLPPPPQPTAASTLCPGRVALKFSSKWWNLIPLLVHTSGFGVQTRVITPFDGGGVKPKAVPPHGLAESLQPNHGRFSLSPFEICVPPDRVRGQLVWLRRLEPLRETGPGD